MQRILIFGEQEDFFTRRVPSRKGEKGVDGSIYGSGGGGGGAWAVVAVYHQGSLYVPAYFQQHIPYSSPSNLLSRIF